MSLLVEKLNEVVAMVAATDLEAVPRSELLLVLPACARLCASVESLAGRAQVLVSETSLVQDQGFRSVPAFVASASGETEHRARQALALAEGVSQLPSLDTATRQGTVSQRQALAIVRGANGDDSRARQLIDVANDNCLKELEARARQGSGFRSAEEEQNHFNKLYEARSCTGSKISMALRF